MINVSNRLRRIALYYRRARGLWHELLAVAVCLALGVLVMPCLIFAAGRLVLGPYAQGNLFALWHDYLQGLVAGSHAYWFIAAGPYLLLWLLRGGRRLLRRTAPAT
ncbi:MAG TPA: hypothetical protein VIX87_10010 [Steroidobacteraceae bacterium]